MAHHPVSGYLKSRQVALSVLGTAVSLALALFYLRANLTLHFDPEGSTIRLGLLTPVICALFVNVSLNDPVGEAESIFVARIRSLRAWHMLCQATPFVLGIGAVALVSGIDEAAGQFFRNSAWMVGLVLVAAVATPHHAWVAPIGSGLAMYGFGIDYSTGIPRAWAVLLHDLTPANLLAGGGVLAVGVALFIVRGPHPLSPDEMEF